MFLIPEAKLLKALYGQKKPSFRTVLESEML